MKKLIRIIYIVLSLFPILFIFAAMSFFAFIATWCNLSEGGYSAYKEFYKTGKFPLSAKPMATKLNRIPLNDWPYKG